MAVGVVAAGAFALGSRAGMVAGALLLQAAFTLDCVDGQLARYTHNFSKLGAWLDSVFDRGKEYLVFAGLAAGAAHGFHQNAWVLAGAALTLQSTRHMIDFAFARTHHVVVAAVPAPTSSSRSRRSGGSSAAASATASATRALRARAPGASW